MTAIPGIDNRMRHVTTIAVNASLGDEKELRRLINVGLQGPLKLSEIDEVLLQVALFSGVPRALNAFRILGEALAAQEKETREAHLEEAREFRSRTVSDPTSAGVETFQAVYGDLADSVRRALAAQHSAFEAWILNRAYGEILSREGLDLKTRELIAVAVLTAMDLPVQLWGHMKGALANGASAGEIKAVLSLNSLYIPETSDANRMIDRLGEA